MNGYKRSKGPLQSVKYLLFTVFMVFLFTLTHAQTVFISYAHPFASSSTAVPTTSSNQDQAFALARVSVVRLLVSYTSTDGKPVASCTGLGVLVKSLPVSGGQALNNLVLTYASLVNKTQAVCTNGKPAGTLSQVKIYFNTTYNSQRALSFSADRTAITCPGPNITCTSGGFALIAFQGDPVPFVDFAPSLSGITSQTGLATNVDRPIGLTKDGVMVSSPPASGTDLGKYTTTITGFLTPQLVSAHNAGNKPEPGTPFIDANGFLTNLQVGGVPVPVTQNIISSLITSNPALSAFTTTTGNSVNSNWKQGITAYYAKKYAAAQADFQQAAKDNANFQGAKDFATFAQDAPNARNPASNSQSTDPGFFLPGTNIFVGLWVSSVVAPMVFALLLLLASLIFGLRVQRRRAFKADLPAWLTQSSTTSAPRVEFNPIGHKNLNRPNCPYCGKFVSYDTNYCPNCRMRLTPSESDLNLHIPPSTSSAPSSTTSTPRVEFDATDIRANINAWQLREPKGE